MDVQYQSNAGVMADKAWPQTSMARNIILMLAGSWLIAMTAQIALPIGPVPITGQTFGVLLIAALLGSRLGAGSVITYLIQGAMGLPFFAGGMAGTAVFAGPTAGYLIGFIAAAFVVGWLAERGWDRSPARTVVMMLLGTAVIYAFGLLWLSTFTGWANVLTLGMVPFLPGDILKVMLAAVMLPTGWKLLGR
jgi:biotin transport system substrate-specific component